MKKILSAILITMLAFSIICATSVYSATNTIAGENENQIGGGSEASNSLVDPTENQTGSGGSGTSNSTVEPNESGVNWPDLSGAKFNMYKDSGNIKLDITNVSTATLKEFEKYRSNGGPAGNLYVYLSTGTEKFVPSEDNKTFSVDPQFSRLSQNSTSTFKKDLPILYSASLRDDNTCSVDIVCSEIYALNSDVYGSIYGQAYDTNDKLVYKELVPPTKITKPSRESIGNRIKANFYTDNDAEEEQKYGRLKINESSSINQKHAKVYIGKITDESIINNFKNNTADRFEKLVEYAQKKNNVMKTIDITMEDEGTGNYRSQKFYCDLNELDLQRYTYYYVYSYLDGENGKYISFDDIDICECYVSYYHNWRSLTSVTKFDSGDDVDNGNYVYDNISLNDNLAKDDPTTPDGKLPQTGVGVGVTASIVTTTLLTIISFVVYSKNKDLR